MKTIVAKIIDPTHLELTHPISMGTGEYIEIVIPEDNEAQLWQEAGKKNFLKAYDDEDSIYDKL